ncbi:[protein-PII] uridylyltransferase [Neisseria animalis]|uniref:Bifunctional uridylyltransferase/uridylyl-removing enzyme n=1 Tax=Neisseria animalis TaxID=492 RepID=A0A5P3MQG4_NEIAN|nr:[protein-PII] uridylyltransferase [Neisseria animalis]QEY23305.1 [protein-PII] uridylyltransferase [Neisseria animalis]ROW33154.1 [protein-PII] uridylyltransferase [Neisseria animalis]VEE08643.1 uridylyltransferase [Neisseria animalis]
MPYRQTARNLFEQQQQQAIANFLAKPQPTVFFQAHCAAVETLLRTLWSPLFDGSGLCLMATGGFGRGELYPHSDLDLAIVSTSEIADGIQEKIALFIQTLWDMKFKPSVKSGSVAQLCDSAAEDITGDTAFLEARLLCGDEAPARQLIQETAARRDVTAFIEAKLLEMHQRHNKSQGSGAVLEPNIKSCPGGLRDIHTMLWLAKAQGLDTGLGALISQAILTRTEAGMLSQCYKQLAAIRIHLHICARRAEDRLIFDLQGKVAESMGNHDDDLRRKSEKLMRIFYRTVKTVTQLNGILLPMLQGRVSHQPQQARFPIDGDYVQIGNQIAAADTAVFQRDSRHIFKIIELLQERNDITALEPQTLRAWWAATRHIDRRFYNDEANRRRFVGFFRNSQGLTHVLRFLNLYGVLGSYLPAWEKIVGLLQHDLFHIYPVDDHILTVVHNMRRLSLDSHSHELPFASALMQSFPQQSVLYLAAFFHDIAKGRGGDHAIEGIADARQFAADHFLSVEEADLLAWLVEDHLLMSAVAQKEDIQDPDVLRAFCERVQTHERLAALYLLTVADIRGTNPKLWNNWRASLLESLFHAATRYLSGNGNNAKAVFSHRQQEAVELLTRAGAPEKQQKKLWNALGSAYFVRHQSREILWHTANLVHDFETPLIRSRILPKSDSFQVMIFMPNGPRLFARLCRIFSRHGFDILAARAFITEHNYILDTFILHIPAQHDPDDYPNIQSALEAELNSFIHGHTVLDQQSYHYRISRRSRFLPLAPSVTITQEEDYPGWYTVDVIAVNRAYLLADLAEVFFAHEVSLRYAKIATLDERVEDSFIVYSQCLDNPKHQQALKQALLAQLTV